MRLVWGRRAPVSLIASVLREGALIEKDVRYWGVFVARRWFLGLACSTARQPAATPGRGEGSIDAAIGDALRAKADRLEAEAAKP